MRLFIPTYSHNSTSEHDSTNKKQEHDFVVMSADTNSSRPTRERTQYCRKGPLHAVRQYNSHNSPETALTGRRETPLKGIKNSNLETRTKKQFRLGYLPASFPASSLPSPAPTGGGSLSRHPRCPGSRGCCYFEV